MVTERGQTLLEITISLGVAVVVVTALTIVTISGLRNSQFAQNQATATKLAQDWLEQVRSMRDQNATVCDPIRGVYNWNDLVTGLYSSSPWNNNCGSSACYYVVRTNPPTGCTGNPNTTTATLLIPVTQNTPDTQGSFTRIVSIQNYGIPPDPRQKKVTSTVSWNDFSGPHSSILETILSQP